MRAQNERVHEVLYNQAPNELYDDDTGLPQDMDAKNTIFALQKDAAENSRRTSASTSARWSS